MPASYSNAHLSRTDLSPDVKAKLANSTEAELRSLQSSLHSAKDNTVVEFQKNALKK